MPPNRNKFLLPLAAFSLILGLNACTESEDDPDDGIPDYDVPDSYSAFEKVDFSGQTARLDMLAKLSAYVKTANTPGTEVDADKMKAMFANAGNPFDVDGLNTSGKQIKDKTFLLDRGMFEGYFDSVASISGDTVSGAKGRAGLVANAAGTSKYLLNAQGVEYAQLIEKGLMGALAYYQGTAVYLDSTDKLGASVADSVKAHHWDEAFGYFTSSVNFPAEGKDRFWSKYCNDRNAIMGSNAKMLRAFAKGRAAIDNQDRKGMLEAIDSVRHEWELVSVATAIQYFNSVKRNLTDDGARNHQLSEGIAFVRALKYNPARKISDDQIEEIEGFIGSDFYAVTQAGVDQAIDLLSGIYGLDSVKATL